MEKEQIIIPKGPVLIVMVGPSGAGKSTFIEKHFEDREVVSSDDLRTWFTGQFERQDKNQTVFAEFHHRIEARLRAGQRVVADATHLRDGDRKRTAEIGYLMNVPVFYVVINRSVVGKLQTAGWRKDVRIKGKSLIEAHEETFVANEKKILAGDDQKWVTVVDTRREDLEVTVAKELPRDRIDALRFIYNQDFNRIRVIGDVHGDMASLVDVTACRGHGADDTFFLFLGDITDYGNASWECARLVNRLVSDGRAAMVRGNHDRKMSRYIEQTMAGKEFSGHITHGMDVSTNQLKAMNPDDAIKYQTEFMSLVEQAPDWIELGDWIFVHAAVASQMYDNPLFRAHANSRLESLALYGETDGTKTPDGFPTRLYNWIDELPERKNAVLGHQILSTEAPVEKRSPSGGRVVFLDTGCSKDGFLSFWDFEIQKHGKGGWRIEPHEEFGRVTPNVHTNSCLDENGIAKK